MTELILASGSPRRSELLRKCGVSSFRVVPAEVEELASTPENHARLALANAEIKAEAVAKNFPDAFVIGADTVIEFGSECIGKPRDIADAHAILKRLSGNTHAVATGVCVRNISKGITISFTDLSLVTFRRLTDEIIEEYLRRVHVLDKAGAYAIQEHGDMLIEKISGSMDNIIGLPTERLAESLRIFLFELR